MLSPALLGGCSLSDREGPAAALGLPPAALDGWVRGGDSTTEAVPWLAQFKSAELDDLVAAALANNFQLRQQRARVRELSYGITVAGAALWPSLSTSLSASRRRVISQPPFPDFSNNQFTLSTNLSWDVDLWGRLAAGQQAARLTFAAELAGYVGGEQALAASVASSYFAAVEAAQLEALFSARLQTLEESLDIVESGYRSGLNAALDVYLAQNAVAQEQGNLAAQRQTVLATRAQLELLLADYPAGRRATPVQLPSIAADVPVTVPSTLVTRRSDLQASWLALLAADARVAVAHRQRFPSLGITASLSDSNTPFNELLNGGPLAWSMASNIAQPIFQGGRLRAAERQAREQVEQTEAAYLNLVFSAFAEVENGISQEQALRERLLAADAAQENAESALELAFEQYRSGLVTFTTVLESQRRAFDAQTARVRLAAAQLQNRIALNQALGGAFDGGADQRISDLFGALYGRRTKVLVQTELK